jgi:hypothetical protein
MSAPPCGIQKPGPDARVIAPGEPSGIRVEKVLEIRRQLSQGTYRIAARLRVAIERMIKALG